MNKIIIIIDALLVLLSDVTTIIPTPTILPTLTSEMQTSMPNASEVTSAQSATPIITTTRSDKNQQLTTKEAPTLTCPEGFQASGERCVGKFYIIPLMIF